MSRLPRLAVAGQLHLVIQRGHHGQAVFLEPADFESYRQHLRDAAQAHQVAVHAYSLIADEAMLLVTPAHGDALGRMVQAQGRRFVRGYNLRHRRSGTLWEGRFAATVVDAARHGIACLRLVESQAVEAGLVAQAADYAWSSAAHHVGDRVDPLITEHAVFWPLGNTPFEREARFRQLLQQPLGAQERNLLRQSALKGWVVGDAQFEGLVAGHTGRRLKPLPRGRPRKAAAVTQD